MPEGLHVYISGRVQGVGYRQSTYHEAIRLGLTGWVRNLSDGRVEAFFEGSRAVQEEMLGWCWKGPSFASVKGIEVVWEESSSACSTFEIRI